jgi:cytochrome b subunit of formate dehydrogenase
MNRRELASVLAAHADGLIRGKDTAAELLLDYPEDATELGALFRLASSIQAALVPVKAPVRFVSQLREDLMTFSPEKGAVQRAVSGQKVLWLGVATAGSVLSVTGLVLLVARRLRTSGKTGQQTATTAV